MHIKSFVWTGKAPFKMVLNPPIITDATVSPELGCAHAVPSEMPTT
jgi:hypothetical protein